MLVSVSVFRHRASGIRQQAGFGSIFARRMMGMIGIIGIFGLKLEIRDWRLEMMRNPSAIRSLE